MTPNPLLVEPKKTSLKQAVKLPLILLAVFIGTALLGYKWLGSYSGTFSPKLFHQTDATWRPVPAPPGYPQHIRVSNNGTVWAQSWEVLSRWDGKKWQSFKETSALSQSGSNSGFFLDGEKIWAPTSKCLLYWDGAKWYCDPEAPSGRGASVVEGDGQIWLIDRTGVLSTFKDGHWEKHLLSAPGLNWTNDDNAADPILARTADGAIWLMRDGIWRFDGATWTRIKHRNDTLEGASPVGATGDRIWLDYSDTLLSVSMDGTKWTAYSSTQTGIPEDAAVQDVTSTTQSLWFATSKGLVKFDGSDWLKIPPPDAKLEAIEQVTAGLDGSLWIIGRPAFQPPQSSLRYLMILIALLPLAALIDLLWMFQRIGRRNVQQHQIVSRAVLHATGEIPGELERGGQRLAKASSWGGTLFTVFAIAAAGVVYALLRAKWPGTPAWIIPVIVIAAHSLVALQQSMVKRKPQPSDPIGPGSPSQYDWGKTGKAALGAILLYGFIYAESIPGLKFLHGYWFWIVLVGPIAYQLLIARPLNQSLRRGDYNRTLQLVRLTHFYNPSGPEALRISGHALLAAGRYREAEEALRQSLSRSQASEAHGVALEQLGEALMEQGRNEEAMRSFQAALQAFPWRHRPYRGMAEMLLRQGKNPAQALEYIEKIIDFTGLTWRQRKMNGKPQDDYWALKAWALAEMGRSSEVPDAIENALKATDPKVRPDMATTHYRIGMAMQALGNLTSANDHFKLAVEFDPKGRRGTQATAALRSAYTHVH